MTTKQQDEAVTISAPVREVVLLEDRARVVRRGDVECASGLVKVRVSGVAPVLSDKTVTAEITSAGATVVDARVLRRLQVSYDEAERPGNAMGAALSAELEALAAEIDRAEMKKGAYLRQVSSLDKIAALTFAELSEDVSWGKEIGPDWTARLDALRDRERELRQGLIDMEADIEELNRKRRRLHERLQALQDPAEREWAAIEVDLLVAEPGRYTLVLEYAVPSACWRPYHTARLLESDSEGSARLAFRTDACVWQHTGEDWSDVELAFSTERASLGVEPPALRSDVIRVQRRSDAIVVEARDKEIQHAGLGADPVARESSELPGIDDGGQALHLRAGRRSSVPSDGKPYRVEIQAFESSAEVELVAMPELAACVLQRSVQVNRAPVPILAGPVDLIRQSGLVGRTSVGFIAAGERFELGWGPENDLRIKRITKVTDEESRMLSSWSERVHTVELMLSNIGGRKRTVQVKERMPVAEIDKVKIEVDAKKTTGQKAPDANGFVTWDVALGGGGHELVVLRYRVKKHDDVVGM